MIDKKLNILLSVMSILVVSTLFRNLLSFDSVGVSDNVVLTGMFLILSIGVIVGLKFIIIDDLIPRTFDFFKLITGNKDEDAYRCYSMTLKEFFFYLIVVTAFVFNLKLGGSEYDIAPLLPFDFYGFLYNLGLPMMLTHLVLMIVGCLSFFYILSTHFQRSEVYDYKTEVLHEINERINLLEDRKEKYTEELFDLKG
ncbi:hypothetical protein [Vibrio sp. 10N.237.312.B06]|uniref:hypothetical protein n=1 Tax=Vibrio sp. 10N.237.312.B06 TaxID=3229974 RepID=UPI00354C3C95